MPGEAARRPGFRQDLIWRLEAAAFAGFIGLMRLIGLEAASNFGGLVLKTLGPVTGTQKTVLRNLRIAFPGMGEEDRQRLALAQWEQTGRTFAETAVMDRLTPASGRIDIVGAERLEAIRASGKPVVFAAWSTGSADRLINVLGAAAIARRLRLQPVLAVGGMLAPVEQPRPGRSDRARTDRTDDLAVGDRLSQQAEHGLVLEARPGVRTDQQEDVRVRQDRIIEPVVCCGQQPAYRGLGLAIRRSDFDLDAQMLTQKRQDRPGLPIGPARLQKCDGDSHRPSPNAASRRCRRR